MGGFYPKRAICFNSKVSSAKQSNTAFSHVTAHTVASGYTCTSSTLLSLPQQAKLCYFLELFRIRRMTLQSGDIDLHNTKNTYRDIRTKMTICARFGSSALNSTASLEDEISPSSKSVHITSGFSQQQGIYCAKLGHRHCPALVVWPMGLLR